MSQQSEIRVAICICTFRRQKLLRELLDGIAQLRFRKVQEPQIQIVAVDNDELASAAEVCAAVSVPWSVKYVVEPRPGITHVRNRAIAEAGSVDFVAFIDDDEVPSTLWLDELLWAQVKFNADVVSGPVFPKFAQDVPTWVQTGGFFEARVHCTGTVRRTCASNNVLVGTRVFRNVPRFDDAFALSGAEDTNFFLRVRQAGYKIVWSQEAHVFETVSAQRASVAWMLRREYQTGNGWVFCEAGVDQRTHRWAIRFSKGCGHVVLGLAGAIWRSFTFDRAAVMRSLQRVSLGIGMLVGLAGHRFLAYKNHETKSGKLESVAASVE